MDVQICEMVGRSLIGCCTCVNVSRFRFTKLH
jgi:hypothetical protein